MGECRCCIQETHATFLDNPMEINTPSATSPCFSDFYLYKLITWFIFQSVFYQPYKPNQEALKRYSRWEECIDLKLNKNIGPIRSLRQIHCMIWFLSGHELLLRFFLQQNLQKNFFRRFRSEKLISLLWWSVWLWFSSKWVSLSAWMNLHGSISMNRR